MTQNKDKAVCEMEKNKSEKVVFGTREWQGKRYFSARVWFKPKNNGQFYPSPKGITLAIDKLPEFMEGLCKLAESEGLDVKK